MRQGSDFTVWGASYSIRNRYEHAAVAGRRISVVGWIVATNLDEAPRCAVHARGQADPPGCVAAIPAFWLGDTPDAARADSIKVEGWASNYAQLHDALLAYAKGAGTSQRDEIWDQPIPNPIPARGAKVRVVGRYSVMFTKASTGIEADPIMGILDYEHITVLEPAPKRATLPGMQP